LSLTHTFNLIGSMMKPSFDPGSGNNIPAGTNFARTTPSGETTWDSNNAAVLTSDFEVEPASTTLFLNSTSQLYLRMEKTANGMEINFLTPDTNEFGVAADEDYWINTSNQFQEATPQTEYTLYENNSVSFDAFKFVLTTREVDHNGDGFSAIPQDRLRAPGATQTTPYDDQNIPWFSVTNTGDKAAYELLCLSAREYESQGNGSTQNGANRIVECWGRAQGYADTLLVTYTVQAYAEARIGSV